jgi:DNA-binding MarR family transcriptional regulator
MASRTTSQTDPVAGHDPGIREDPAEMPNRVRTVVARLGRHLRQTRAGAGLTPTQYQVLATVVRLGPVRLSDLATEEGLNPTMLSRIAGKLEAAGLLVRAADATDGRVAVVSASDDGLRLVRRVRSERTDALSRALDGLGPGQRRTLADALPVLEALAESLKDRSVPAGVPELGVQEQGEPEPSARGHRP